MTEHPVRSGDVNITNSQTVTSSVHCMDQNTCCTRAMYVQWHGITHVYLIVTNMSSVTAVDGVVDSLLVHVCVVGLRFLRLVMHHYLWKDRCSLDVLPYIRSTCHSKLSDSSDEWCCWNDGLLDSYTLLLSRSSDWLKSLNPAGVNHSFTPLNHLSIHLNRNESLCSVKAASFSETSERTCPRPRTKYRDHLGKVKVLSYYRPWRPRRENRG